MENSLRVLLVHDDRSYLKLLGNTLTQHGIEVVTAVNGKNALSKAKASSGNFDVAVIDQEIGSSDGTEVMFTIRQYFPMIEAIILSGREDMKSDETPTEIGAIRYISNLVDAHELELNIRSAARISQERKKNHLLQTLVSAGQGMGGVKSEEDLYLYLLKEAAHILPALDGILISRYEEESREVSFPFAYTRGQRISVPPRLDGNSITEYVLLTKQPLLLPFGDKEFRAEYGLNPPDVNLGYCASELVVPIFLDGKIHGTIQALTYEQDIHYTLEQLQILQAFSNQIAINIRNFQQLEEVRMVKDATAKLASTHSKKEVLEAIVESAHFIVRSDFTGIILQEEDGTLKKARPVKPDTYFDRFDEPRQKGGVTHHVVATRQPKIIRDTHKDPLVKESVRKDGIRSMLALPLVYGNRVLGVLFTHTLSLRQFGRHDVDLWASFASQAAAALDRAIEEEKQIEDYKRLAGVLETFISEKNSFADVMLQVATAAKIVFAADTCRLAYVDPPTGRIIDWSWAEGDQAKYRFESEPRPNGLTNYVLQTKKPLFRTIDNPESPQPVQGLLSRGLKSVATLPLIYNSRVIGILHCNFLEKRRPFNEHFRTLLEAFGARAAVALHRAHRDHISEIWRELEKKILGCTSLRDLAKIFTEHTHSAFGADFSVFYPYDPTSSTPYSMPLLRKAIRIGELRTPWKQPKGGIGGGVRREIEQNSSGLLIVNQLPQGGGHFLSNLTHREAVNAFVAVRLEVTLPGKTEPRLAGILFLNYRKFTAFESADLIDLRNASELTAAVILKMHLQMDLQKAFDQRNMQLSAVIDIFRKFEYESRGLNLDSIAEGAAKSLGIDVCTFLQFEPKKGRFYIRGSYGLRHLHRDVLPRVVFKDRFMDADGPTIIKNVDRDELMRVSKFVKKEGIRSAVVYPLLVEGEPHGIFFANYRTIKEPSAQELKSLRLFADLAAWVFHASELMSELSDTQLKLQRRYFLIWVSMIEDSWRHSLVQKALSIRNNAANILKRLQKQPDKFPLTYTIRDLILDIDRCAYDISAAPPRVPHYWEMQKEFVPLTPLIKEVAAREFPDTSSPTLQRYSVHTHVNALSGIEIKGYRRWLIYLLEALLQNARNAMPAGGTVTITGTIHKEWVEIRIMDTGNGVQKALQNKLFKEVLPRKKDRDGLGIGSLLAASLAEEHGGSIELEHPGPKRTTVLLRLPVARKAAKN